MGLCYMRPVEGSRHIIGSSFCLAIVFDRLLEYSIPKNATIDFKSALATLRPLETQWRWLKRSMVFTAC